MRVVVSQHVTVRFVEYTMNSLCFGKAMHEAVPTSGTGHSATADSMDASNCLM